MSAKKVATPNLGILFVFVASLFHSISGLCMKFIPWNGMSINSARNLVAICVMGIFLYVTKHPPKLNKPVILGALCVTATQVFFSLANKLTTAANTIVLQFTTPVFIILLSMIFWHKKPKKLDILACLVVMSGVTCFVMDGLAMGGMIGNVLALASGLTNATVYLLRDMEDGDQLSSFFWGGCLSVLVGLPFLMQETVFTGTAITSVLILGAFNVAIAHILIYIGMRTTPAVTASLISGIEPILNPVLVAVFYGEAVGSMAFVGGAIVIVGVVGYNVLKEKFAEPVSA